MQSIDWILLAVPILLLIAVAAYTRHFMRSVADFMAGGRAAGRYLICNAKGEASSGVANTLSKFQPLLAAGFVLTTEAINTAIEIDINLTSPQFHPYARDTKDVAAAAVLISALTAVIIGLTIFIPHLLALRK